MSGRDFLIAVLAVALYAGVIWLAGRFIGADESDEDEQ